MDFKITKIIVLLITLFSIVKVSWAINKKNPKSPIITRSIAASDNELESKVLEIISRLMQERNSEFDSLLNEFFNDLTKPHGELEAEENEYLKYDISRGLVNQRVGVGGRNGAQFSSNEVKQKILIEKELNKENIYFNSNEQEKLWNIMFKTVKKYFSSFFQQLNPNFVINPEVKSQILKKYSEDFLNKIRLEATAFKAVIYMEYMNPSHIIDSTLMLKYLQSVQQNSSENKLWNEKLLGSILDTLILAEGTIKYTLNGENDYTIFSDKERVPYYGDKKENTEKAIKIISEVDPILRFLSLNLQQSQTEDLKLSIINLIQNTLTKRWDKLQQNEILKDESFSSQNNRLHTERLVLFHYMRKVDEIFNALKVSDKKSITYLKLKELQAFSKRAMSFYSKEVYDRYNASLDALVKKNTEKLQTISKDNINSSGSPSCFRIF